jgi:hypothetical protein
MSKVNSLISERFKNATEKLSKMTSIAERSSFSGVFRITPLSLDEQTSLADLLNSYKNESTLIDDDLKQLLNITSEVKAINNQAAILHGERIKKAQDILKKYRDGAFSAWLIAVYGNRQTPYNFLQYFELHKELSPTLHPKLEAMPRQAVYTLASRDAPFEKKEEIIRNFTGGTKKEMLALIRKEFPLEITDKRSEDRADQTIKLLRQALEHLENKRFKPTPSQKKEIADLLKKCQTTTSMKAL